MGFDRPAHTLHVKMNMMFFKVTLTGCCLTAVRSMKPSVPNRGHRRRLKWTPPGCGVLSGGKITLEEAQLADYGYTHGVTEAAANKAAAEWQKEFNTPTSPSSERSGA